MFPNALLLVPNRCKRHEQALVMNETISRDHLVGAEATRRRTRAAKFLLQVRNPNRSTR